MQDYYLKTKNNMRRILSFIFAFALLSFASASAQAVIKFEKVQHDFGHFTEEKPVSYKFVFENTGDQPLVIQQAISSCGCTVANYTKTPIKPGEKGEVNVTYNGKGKVPGHFKKAITIRSNASNSLARIYITGEMDAKQ